MKLSKFISLLFIVATISLSVVSTAYAGSTSDARTHDGFYLRLSLGGQLAGLNRSVKIDDSSETDYEGGGDSQVRGGGGMSEITLGGTPATGLVLGGSMFFGNVFDPKIEFDDDREDLKLDSDLQFAMWGFTVDYYIDENSGFHFGGTFGGAVAGAALPDEDIFEYIGGWGWAASLATGYDWWIANQWSLGVLARIILAGVMGEDSEEGVKAEENSGYLAIGILFTAVYH